MARQPKRVRLSHLDGKGGARMVDVSAKSVTVREAAASAEVHMQAEVLEAMLGGSMPKGDAVAAARLAGILAAKRTAELIPLCHPLSLEHVQVELERSAEGTLRIVCTARTAGRTGVEMEALTGAAVAALTIYDMGKAADRGMVIGPIQLERKSGGKSGNWARK